MVEKDRANILMVIKNRNNLLRDITEFISLEIFKNRLDAYFPSVTEVSCSQGTSGECVRLRAVLFLTLCCAVVHKRARGTKSSTCSLRTGWT